MAWGKGGGLVVRNVIDDALKSTSMPFVPIRVKPWHSSKKTYVSKVAEEVDYGFPDSCQINHTDTIGWQNV